MTPERTLRLVGLWGGLLFLALTPPFQAPDEPSHFRRIYQLSQGVLFPRAGGEGSLPESVVRISQDLRGDLPFHPERRVDRAAWRAAFEIPLAPERRGSGWIGGAVYSTPASYLPQGLAAWAGREIGLPPLVLFYLCRLVNLVSALALAVAAVRIAPFYRWLFALLALDPMALFLRSSLSPDALVDAAALLWVAVVLALATGSAERRRGRRGRLALLLGAATFLVLAKGAVYALLPALALLIPAARLGGRRRAAAVLGALLALTLAGVALSSWGARRAYFPGLRPEVATDSAAQVGEIVHHPARFLGIALRTGFHQAPKWAFQLVGNLGWLDTPLPHAVALGYALLLLFLALVDGSPDFTLGVGGRLGIATITVGTLLALLASQYVLWTAVGAAAIEGVQGRYLLPLAPAAALLFHHRRWALERSDERVGRWLAAAAALTITAALVTTALRYYGPP